MSENERVQDPVCGMRFEPDQAATTADFDGRTFHFCCDSCRLAFEAEPGRFLRREAQDQRGAR